MLTMAHFLSPLSLSRLHLHSYQFEAPWVCGSQLLSTRLLAPHLCFDRKGRDLVVTVLSWQFKDIHMSSLLFTKQTIHQHFVQIKKVPPFLFSL